MSKQQIIKIVISVLIAALTALGAALGLQSCKVWRTVSTTATYVQSSDSTKTTQTISTKTVEEVSGCKEEVIVPLRLRNDATPAEPHTRIGECAQLKALWSVWGTRNTSRGRRLLMSNILHTEKQVKGPACLKYLRPLTPDFIRHSINL